MSKKKKGGHEKPTPTEIVLLATASLKLAETLISLIKKLTE